MNTHLTYEQMRDYHQRILSRDIRRSFRSHIEECERCRRKLCEIADVKRSVKNIFGELELADLKDTKHITYNKAVAYMSDRIDDDARESLGLHLERCTYCSDRIAHLKDFKSSLVDAPWKKLASDVQIETEPSRASLIASLKSLLFFYIPSWRYVWLTLAVSVLLVTALFVIRHNGNLEPNIDKRGGVMTGISVQVPPSNTDSKVESPNSSLAVVSSSINNSTTTSNAQFKHNSRNERPLSQPSGRTFRHQERRTVTTERDTLAGLQSYPQEIESVVKMAVQTGRLDIKPLPGLSGDRQMLLGEAEEEMPFRLFYPLGIVIETQQPVFRWGPLSEATAYSVSIFDKNGNEVETSPILTTTEWRVSKKLARGQIYTWQVIATKGGKEFLSPKSPAPEARFIVLDQDKFGQIESIRKTSPNFHLALGVLYAQAHLLHDAESEFALFVEDNPENPQAKGFLQQVRALNKIKQ